MAARRTGIAWVSSPTFHQQQEHEAATRQGSAALVAARRSGIASVSSPPASVDLDREQHVALLNQTKSPCCGDLDRGGQVGLVNQAGSGVALSLQAATVEVRQSNAIALSGQYNYNHCMVPVQSNLNISSWKTEHSRVSACYYLGLLEAWAVMVGLKIWATRLSGLRCTIRCDNSTTTLAINSLKTKSKRLRDCVREIMFTCAQHQVEIRAVHIPGLENRVPDWLSRMHLDTKYARKFRAWNKSDRLIPASILPEHLKISHDW